MVIALAALAFHSLSSALYGLVSLYISSLVIDRVLYGLDNAKVAYIISDRPQEIIRSISTELDRGVTILGGRGRSGEQRRAHVRLQAEADRGPEAGGKGDRPSAFSSCAMPTRCWVRASTAITSMTCDPFIFQGGITMQIWKNSAPTWRPAASAPPTSPPQMRRPPIWTARSMGKRWASAGP